MASIHIFRTSSLILNFREPPNCALVRVTLVIAVGVDAHRWRALRRAQRRRVRQRALVDVFARTARLVDADLAPPVSCQKRA